MEIIFTCYPWGITVVVEGIGLFDFVRHKAAVGDDRDNQTQYTSISLWDVTHRHLTAATQKL